MPDLEFDRVDDLLQGYFDALRTYNRRLGAFEMTPDQIRDARRREADDYARVQKFKAALLERALFV